MTARNVFRKLPVLLLILTLASCYQQRRLVNGKNHLKPADWAGTYEGRLRGMGDSSVATRIALKDDGTYTRTSARTNGLSKPYTEAGNAVWDQAKGLVVLQPANSSLNVPYRINKKGLIMMHLGTGDRLREERPEYTLYKVTAAQAANPTEHYWSLTMLNGRAIATDLPGKRPHVLFHRATGKTNGNGGCNNFSGTFELLSGNRLKISPLASTRMACGANQVETEFLKTLEGITRYQVANDTLTLARDGKTVAVFEAVWMN